MSHSIKCHSCWAWFVEPSPARRFIRWYDGLLKPVCDNCWIEYKCPPGIPLDKVADEWALQEVMEA